MRSANERKWRSSPSETVWRGYPSALGGKKLAFERRGATQALYNSCLQELWESFLVLSLLVLVHTERSSSHSALCSSTFNTSATPTMSPPATEGGEKPVTGEDGKDAPVDQSKDIKGKGQDQTDIIHPTGLKLALLMISIFIGMFLVSLVRRAPKP